MIAVVDIDGVIVVRLDHGAVNAIDVELATAICDQFSGFAAGDVGAVVLTGAGRAFSAGVDLKRVMRGGPEYVRGFLPVLSRCFEAVFDLERPVVAAINGHALAGGLVLAAACDERIMAAGNHLLGVPEVRAGVPFPSAALELVMHIGGRNGGRPVMTGDVYSPRVALALGLVDEVVADPLSRAIDRARMLAECIPSETYALTKRQVHAEVKRRIARGRADHELLVESAWTRPELGSHLAGYLGGLRRADPA